MKARSVTWRWLVLIVGAAMAGMFAMSVLGIPFKSDSVIAIDTHELPAVSRHQLPGGMRTLGSGGEWQAPTALWLVRQANGWLALSDRTPHPRGCSVAWQPEQEKFVEPCLGQVFDRTGLNIAGPAPRGLDSYPVTVNANGLVTVNVSQPQPVGQ